jgi:ADP-ribosylation factor-binding protein GGA
MRLVGWEIGPKLRLLSRRESNTSGCERVLKDRHNPNKKAADLISFDAFADDEGQLSMSGDGGLSLPSDNTNNASSSSAPPAATAPGGLPLDLFSAPSPTPSPGPSFFTPAYSNSTSQAPRQDPMAFFNTSPAQTQQQPQQRYGPTANTDFFGSFSSAPQGTSSSGFGGSQQSQQRPPQQQQQQQGYSVSTPMMQPTQAQQNRNTNPNQNQTQQQQQQQKKPDAFADLVDLMS